MSEISWEDGSTVCVATVVENTDGTYSFTVDNDGVTLTLTGNNPDSGKGSLTFAEESIGVDDWTVDISTDEGYCLITVPETQRYISYNFNDATNTMFRTYINPTSKTIDKNLAIYRLGEGPSTHEVKAFGASKDYNG